MSWIYPICLRAWHLISISSFLMLFKVEFNGSFRTLVLIDHVIGGKELFLECPLYIHHSTRDLSSGVCGCNPCDMLHETVKEHCSSEPPTIAGFISNSVTHGSLSEVCSASVSPELTPSLYSFPTPQIRKHFQHNSSLILKPVLPCSGMVSKGHVHTFPSYLMRGEPPRSSKCKRNGVIIGSTCFLPLVGHVTFIRL